MGGYQSIISCTDLLPRVQTGRFYSPGMYLLSSVIVLDNTSHKHHRPQLFYLLDYISLWPVFEISFGTSQTQPWFFGLSSHLYYLFQCKFAWQIVKSVSPKKYEPVIVRWTGLISNIDLRNFKVWRSRKKIKIELGPKMYQLFVLYQNNFCWRHAVWFQTHNVNECPTIIIPQESLSKLSSNKIFGMMWYSITRSLATSLFFFWISNVKVRQKM